MVEANVAYPTDSGLLAEGVAKLVKLTASSRPPAWRRGRRTRDRTRSVRRRAHAIAAWLRRRNDDAKEEAKAITGEMATIAAAPSPMPATSPPTPAVACAGTGPARRARPAALVAELERTAHRSSGGGPDPDPTGRRMPDGSTRVVSACTIPMPGPSPRAAWAGRWSSATRPRWSTTPTGSCSTTASMIGNPADAPCWSRPSPGSRPASAEAPRAVTADRGYGEAAVDAELGGLGVKKVVIPRRGKPGVARQQVQRAAAFRSW